MVNNGNKNILPMENSLLTHELLLSQIVLSKSIQQGMKHTWTYPNFLEVNSAQKYQNRQIETYFSIVLYNIIFHKAQNFHIERQLMHNSITYSSYNMDYIRSHPFRFLYDNIRFKFEGLIPYVLYCD